MRAALYHVDAFTDRPYGGNPAMVCILPTGCGEPAAEWMQSLAGDVNLSETTFLLPMEEPGTGDYQIRWFTPRAEVPICGHATLASAHAIYESGLKIDTEIKFSSQSGMLPVCRDEKGGMFWLDFPRQDGPEIVGDKDLMDQVSQSLGVLASDISYMSKTLSNDFLVVLPSEQSVRSLAPDFRKIMRLPKHRGVIATAKAAGGASFDFVSRFFAPAVGIDEDPVTGSAHCALAPFWAKHLDKDVMTGLQCSSRQGIVECRVVSERVHVGGKATTIYEGSIELPASSSMKSTRDQSTRD